MPLSVFQVLFKANFIFKDFSNLLLFSKTFQNSPVYSSTFQACANPGDLTIAILHGYVVAPNFFLYHGILQRNYSQMTMGHCPIILL